MYRMHKALIPIVRAMCLLRGSEGKQSELAQAGASPGKPLWTF